MNIRILLDDFMIIIKIRPLDDQIIAWLLYEELKIFSECSL